MKHTYAVFSRELETYFTSSIAYVFLVIFLLLINVLTFYVGSFIERDQADLKAFFSFHPWIYILLMPAIAMRLWSEELKSGTIEILLTLPLTISSVVIGKFLAAWFFALIGLGLTFPIWLSVSYLGDPDHGVIVIGYLGSALMAGGYLSICACLSALTKHQITAFILGVACCFIMTVSGFPIVLDAFSLWGPEWLIDGVAAFSFMTRFNNMIDGLINLDDIFFFVSLIAFWLFTNGIVIEMNKAK